jgi:large repetitive protein
MLAKIRRWAGRVPAGLHGTNRSSDERGATLVEYALLLALIAAVAVGSLVFLGQSTTRTLSLAAQKLNTNGGNGGGLPGHPLGDLSDPSNLAAIGGYQEVSLSWSAPATNNSGYPIIGYDVFRGPASDQENANPIVTVTGTSYDDSTPALANGTPYWYEVEAVTAIGNSGVSNEVTATTFNFPSAPSSVTATAGPGKGQVALTWNAPSDGGGGPGNVGAPISGYTVLYNTTNTTTGAASVNTGSATASDTISNLTDPPSTQYFFWVEAINQVGTGPASATAATATTFGLPGAPTLNPTTGADSEVTLTWTAPAAIAGSPAPTGYQILEGYVSGDESVVPIANTTGTTYTVTGLTDGTTYYFEVQAVNVAGAGTPSNQQPGTPVAGEPTAPTDLTAAPGNKLVTLNWDAPADLGTGCPYDDYEVFRGTSTGAEGTTPITTTVGTTTYTDRDLPAGLTNGQTYYYTVKAEAPGVCGGGAASAASNEAFATPGAPGAPTNLTATPETGGAVLLTWKAPATYPGMALISNYDIFQGTTPGGEGTAYKYQVGNVLTDTVTPGTGPFYFTVEAVNSVGAGPPSNEASVTPGAPPAPTLVKATASDGQVALTWTAPTAYAGMAAIDGYDVFDATTAGGEGTTPVNGSLVAGLTYPVTGLTDGTTYYFTVEAHNSAGLGPASNELSATPTGAPGAPTGLTATPGYAFVNFQFVPAITLNWTAPTDTGGAALTKYEVFEGTTLVDTVTGNPPATDDTISTGITAGQTYSFTVEAVNAVPLTGPASNPASAEAGTLGPPTNLTATPGAPSATPGEASVVLNWTAPFPAFGLTGYDVYDSEVSGGEASPAVNGHTLVVGTTYTVTGLTDGQVYYFTVEAVNGQGNSDPSNEASATPGTPGAPTDLTGTGNNQGVVNLTWKAPAANGTETPITYDVYEGTSPGGESTVPVSSGLSSPAVSINGLSDGTTYYFTVAAVNGIGVGPMSNEASAGPGLVPGAVTGLAITNVEEYFGTEYISLDWNAPSSFGSSPITGYDVFEGTSAGGEGTTPIDTVGANQTYDNDIALPTGPTYYFIVEAVNVVGPGAASNEVSVGPPGVPAAVSAAAGPGTGQITVSWTAPTNTGGTGIQSYTILYGTTSTNLNQNTISYGTGTTDTLYGLGNGKTYYFEVEATNELATGTASSPAVSATTFSLPGQTTGVKAVAGPAGGQVTVSWTAPTTGGTPTSYTILWGTTATNLNHNVTSNGTGTTDTLSGFANNSTYYFEVEAVNPVGNGPASTPAVSATTFSLAGAPTTVVATGGAGQVGLTWTAPVNTGNPTLTGYTVLYSNVATMANATSVSTGSTAASYAVKDLVPGFTYYFEVEAINLVGNGPASAPAVHAIPTAAAGVPSAPTNVGLTNTGCVLNGFNFVCNVQVTWTASATGAPTGYEVFVSTTPGGEDYGAAPAATTAGSPVTVTNLNFGTTYYFTVVAINGSGSSVPSGEAHINVT